MTDNTGLIERAREAAARYYENDPLDKARKQIAALIREGRAMDDQDATQIALYALADSDRHYAAALATKDAEIAALKAAKAWYETDAQRDLSRILPDMENKIAHAKTRYGHCIPDHLFAPLEASITELRVLRHELAALGAKP